MRPLLRRLVQIPPPRISLADAEEIARKEAEARGWDWGEPVLRQETLRGFRFRTFADQRGGNAEIIVRGDTGEVTRAWFGPR
jgi:hypothetical protein